MCYICSKLGYEARDRWPHQRGTAGDAKSRQKAATAIRKHRHEQGIQQEVQTRESQDVGAGCLSSRDQSQSASVPDLSPYNPRGYLVLDSGERVPFVSSAGIRKRTNRAEMPIVEGRVGNTKVETLRDTGCSGVIIKQQFVRQDQYTGEYGFIQLADNTVRRVPIARVEIDTPYLSGTVEALCL